MHPDRDPVRLKEPWITEEKCSQCGQTTMSGIFVRGPGEGSSGMMSMNEAVAKGITRLRDPNWPDDAYVRIDLFRDGHGPWVHLYSPREQEAIGKPTPQDLLFSMFDWDAVDCLPYEGTLHESDRA